MAPGIMTGNPSPPAMVAVAIVKPLLEGRARSRRTEGRARARACSIAGVNIACCPRRLDATGTDSSASDGTSGGAAPPSAPISPSSSTRALRAAARAAFALEIHPRGSEFFKW